MLGYVTRRVLWAAALLVIVSAVVFVIFNVLPAADPAKLRAGRNASPEQIEAIRQSYGLDEPMVTRFADYMEGVFLHFDFGTSIFQNGEPVTEIVIDRLPATAFLVAGAVVLWLAIAIPIGVVSAVRQRSLLDRATMITTLALVSAPVFWLGLVGLYLFAGDIGVIPIFPGAGSYSEAEGFFAKAWSLVLPWLVLAAATAAIYVRYLRSSLIDVMGEPYVRTARAKGLPERRVIWGHGVRSAILPLVTLLGLDVGVLLAGNAILTETVFNVPGIGQELTTAIRRSDYELIQGIVLFGAFFIVVLNLIVDIAYAYLDPRVRYQ